MDYKVVVTIDAEEDFERFIRYLILEKENMQAANYKKQITEVTRFHKAE